MAGTKDAINMVEAGAKEVPEEYMLDAIMFGHEEIKRLVAFQEEIAAESGKEKMEVELFEIDPRIGIDIRETLRRRHDQSDSSERKTCQRRGHPGSERSVLADYEEEEDEEKLNR